MRRWLIGWSLAFMLVTLAGAHAAERWRGNARDQRGFPFTERWEGSRDWKPDMPRGWDRPDRLIIDRPGKCEVRCYQPNVPMFSIRHR
jgi:hypothetical protein